MKSVSYKGRKIAACVTAVMMLAITAAPVSAVSEISKEETVYVVTDASGQADDITVSDHLKNSIGADKIHDVTNLSDIENVKGEETFEEEGNGAITWNAAGNDIFYEGTSDDELPVTLGISYFLNGEEVEGSELEGASGDLKIQINYRNNARAEDGTTIPFVAMTGFVVSDDSIEDMEIDHGKIIDDGDKKIVVGLAAPGLNDALNLKDSVMDLDLDLEDSVTITGTAKKYDVQDMMTIVTNSVFEEIDADDLGGLDYDSQINQLDKGAKALMKGSNTLYRGIDTLYGKVPDLEDGVNDLKKGSDALNKGTNNALKGAKELNKGMKELGGKLTSQMNDIVGATGEMEEGTQQIIDGMKQIKGGLDGDGSASNPGAVNALRQVNGGLKDGASQLRASADSIENAAAGAESIYNYLSALENLKNKIGNDKAKAALKKAGLDDGTINTLLGGVSSAKDGAAQLKEGLKSAPAQLNAAADSIDSDSSQSAVGAISQVAGGLENASSALGSYNPDQGTNQSSLIGGLTVVNAGLSEINEKVSGAISDTGELKTGLDSLLGGTSKLEAGEVKLAGGAKQLAKGMESLQEGTGSLTGGVSKLDNGALQLSQGMSKLYRQGIKKIVSMYNNELKGSINDLKDMVDAGQSYSIYSDVADGMTGTVKFIYKTSVY